SSADFRKFEEIAPKGYQAAERKGALLKTFSLGDAAWDAHLAARVARKRNAVPVPQFVAVEGVAGDQKVAVERRLAPLAGEPVDAPAVETRLGKLIGLGTFNSFDYGLTRRDGQIGLGILANEKPHGPPFLNLGITIDGVDPSDIRFGLAARLTLMNVGS